MLIYFVVVVNIFYTVHEKLVFFLHALKKIFPKLLIFVSVILIRPICDVIESIMSTRIGDAG